MEYALSDPYPPVRAEQPNITYARIILDNVSGSNSEMSAVCNYFYNDLIVRQNPEVSEAFHQIMIVEMHHLKIYGELALQLGEIPRMWTQRGRKKVYWTPGYVKYSFDLGTLLINALQSEKAAIKKYEGQLRIIHDESVLENINRIILDEQVHVRIFTELYEKYCRT